MTVDPQYLQPTEAIESTHPAIVQTVRQTAAQDAPDEQKAAALFRFVRDTIRYDPYYPFHRMEYYRASRILADGRGYCVSKAVVLCALCRCAGIPARLGFADVKNHLASGQLLEHMGSDRFVYHGYVQMWLDGRWVSAAPTFDAPLCQRFGVPPLEFDGRNDAVLQAYDPAGRRFIQYLVTHEPCADVPLERILAAWKQTYGAERVAFWMQVLDATGGRPVRDFHRETPVVLPEETGEQSS